MIALDNKKTIKHWTFYDWANSVYSLVISTTIFPIYFNAVSPENLSLFGKELKAEALYTLVISLSFIVISLLSPILSAMADVSGKKRTYMSYFLTLGSISTILLFFFTANNIAYGLTFSFLASIGFSGSLVFYNAFLPEIASEEKQNRVSSRGFALGYLGGAILQILALVIIEAHDSIGIPDKGLATRITFVMVGVWWLLFGIYSISGLPKNPYQRKIPKSVLASSYKELLIVWKELKQNKTMLSFLKAYFLFSTGVQTIILVAALYGSEVLNLPTDSLILTILIIQFIAIPGSLLSARLSDKKGNFFSLLVSTIIWAAICFGAYFIQNDVQFFIFGGLVGLVLGGIQSISRSTYSLLLPKTEDHTTYFSFYDVLEKWSVVFGTLLSSIITQYMDMRYLSLLLSILFVVSSVILLKLHKKKDKR